MLTFSRRQLFGLLAGCIAPDIRAGIIPSAPAQFHEDQLKGNASDPAGQSALEAWQRLPMKPLVSMEDFSNHTCTDREQFLGCVILAHAECQADFEFRYHGGSEPGATRRVLPILLFRKFELTYNTPDIPHIYLLAFCHTRQQARNFRLDRME